MKTFFKISLICIFFMGFYSIVNAQSILTIDKLSDKKLSDTFLIQVDFPPLLDLIDAAIKHNAMVGYRGQEIAAKKENIKTQQNFWLRNLGLQADTRYGTFDNFSTIANAGSTTLQSITNRQLNYGAGLFIKLPVFDVVNRKTQIKQAKAEMEQANYLQQAQADEIRQIVIRQYEELLLKQKLLSIRSQNLGSAIVNTQMVEKEFRNGVIPVFEYVRLSDMTSRIKSEYEMAKSEFIVSKKILEEIVGFSFKNPELSEK